MPWHRSPGKSKGEADKVRRRLVVIHFRILKFTQTCYRRISITRDLTPGAWKPLWSLASTPSGRFVCTGKQEILHDAPCWFSERIHLSTPHECHFHFYDRIFPRVCSNKCLETSHYLSKEQGTECTQMTATRFPETARRQKECWKKTEQGYKREGSLLQALSLRLVRYLPTVDLSPTAQ